MATPCALAKAWPTRNLAVLDARLAFDEMGLAIANALSTQGDVWFSREFLALIDPAPDDVGTVLRNGPHDDDSVLQETLGTALDMWRTAHANGITLGRFRWLGDKPAESTFEAQERPGLLATFDALINTLNPGLELGWSPFVTCGLQSLAIAASMSAEMPVIFTAAKANGGTPALCQDAASAGIACRKLATGQMLPHDVRQNFGRALMLAELMRRPVAAVWLVAPRSGLVTRPDYPAEFVPERFRLTLAECLPWDGAHLFWTDFSDGEDDDQARPSH